MRYSIRTIFLCVIFGFTLGTATISSGQSARANGPICTGVVVTTNAELFSGPGSRYYATESLASGTRLEVWQIRDDGWCAVRPTSHSFSLVAPESLEFDVPGPGLATVKQDGTASYIGSACGSAKHTIQVRLQRGEVVRLIDSQTAANDIWCRIRPPAGEYRWIRADQMHAMPASITHLPTRDSVDSSASGPVHEASQIQERGTSEIRTTAAAIPATDLGSQPATLPPPGSTSRTITAAPVTGSEMPATMDMANSTAQTYGYPMSADAGMTPFQNGLIRISDRMSSMTQGDPSQWDLASLQGEVSSLSGMAGSEEERQQAGMFEQQLVEYQRVQQEIAASGSASHGGGSAGSSFTAPSSIPAGSEMYGNGAYTGNGMAYPPEMTNLSGGNGYSGTNMAISEPEDPSFQGQMKRFFERLQFWKVASPRRNYTGNWAIPSNRPFGTNRTLTTGYPNGMNNGVPSGYSTGSATSTLPIAEATSGQVSGWRPRGQMDVESSTGNGVVFGNQSKNIYQRTIPTTAETVPPPVPEGIGN